MVAKMNEFPGWPIYKIKLAPTEPRNRPRTPQTHFRHVRVDANCGWTADQAIAYSPELKKLGVEFIDSRSRPTAGTTSAARPTIDPADHRRQSCIVESDVARCAGVSKHQHKPSNAVALRPPPHDAEARMGPKSCRLHDRIDVGISAIASSCRS